MRLASPFADDVAAVMDDAAEASRPRRHWTIGDVTIIRAAALLQLATMIAGVVSPRSLLAPFGLPFDEPATFARAVFAVLGVTAIVLFRVVLRPRAEGQLVVESIALVKLAIVSAVVVDVVTRRLAPIAVVGVGVELLFGGAMLRAVRRGSGRR